MNNSQNHQRKSTTHQEKFYHINIEHPKYRTATAFVRFGDSDYWLGSVAFCSKNDNFNRQIGRTIARRRYFQQARSYVSGSNPSVVDIKELINKYAIHFSGEKVISFEERQ